MMTEQEKEDGIVTPEADTAQDGVNADRRAVLRRFGTYAAYTAPGMMVLLGSRKAGAMSLLHGSDNGRTSKSIFAFSC